MSEENENKTDLQEEQKQDNEKNWTDIIAAKGGLDQSVSVNNNAKILNQEEIDALFETLKKEM